jgi:hypothetical protein
MWELMRRRLIWLTFAAIFLFAFPMAVGAAPIADERATVLFGTSKSPDNFLGIWERLLYTEAFSRLNLHVQFIQMSLPRLDAALERGDIDVEAPRQWEYLFQFSGTVRVEEPVVEISFGIYTANPAVQENDLHAMPRNLNVEFRRGIDDCEVVLKAVFPAERISDVATVEQGVMKLVTGRTDLYCDVDYAVMYAKSKLERAKSDSLRKVAKVEQSIRLYTYLSKKNEALAPRLAEVLKQMKEEGLFERYKIQARQAAVSKDNKL